MFITSKLWAIISNKIKPKRMNLLRNLSISSNNPKESNSKLIPSKIECKIKNMAEPTPNIKKYLFSTSLLSF